MENWRGSAEAVRWVGGGDGRDRGGGGWRVPSRQAATPPTAAPAYDYQHPPLRSSPMTRTGHQARPGASRRDEAHTGVPPSQFIHEADRVHPPAPMSTSSVSSSSPSRRAAESGTDRRGRTQPAAVDPASVVDRRRGRSRSRGRHEYELRLAGPAANPDSTSAWASPVQDHRIRQPRDPPVAGGRGGGGGNGMVSTHRERWGPRTPSPSHGPRESMAAATAEPRHRRSRSNVDARLLNRRIDSPPPRRLLTPRVGGDNDGGLVEDPRDSRRAHLLGDRRNTAGDDHYGRRWRPAAVAGGGAPHARSRGHYLGQSGTPGRADVVVAAAAGVQRGGGGHGSGGGGGGSYGGRFDENGAHPVRAMGRGIAVQAAAVRSGELSRRSGDMRRSRSISDLALEGSQPTRLVRPAAYQGEDYRTATARGRGGPDPYQSPRPHAPRPAVSRAWQREGPTLRQSAAEFPYAPSWRSRVCRALLIGATYRYDQDVTKRLPGPDRDVVIVWKMLRDVWGVSDARVTILTDGPEVSRAGLSVAGRPKRETIMAKCREVVNSSMPGDTIFVFFSGHGSRARDTAGDEVDGWDNTIIPTDCATPEGSEPITDDDLYRVLVKDLPPGVRLFAVFDCCHSCNVLGLQGQFLAGDGPNDLPTPRVAVPPEALMEEGFHIGSSRGVAGVPGGDANADDRTRGATSVPDLITRSVRAAMEALAVSSVTHPPSKGVAWCLAACGATATSTNSRGSVGAQGALTDAFVKAVRRAAERAGSGATSGGLRRAATPLLTYWDLRRDIWAQLRAQGLAQVPVLSASSPSARMREGLEL